MNCTFCMYEKDEHECSLKGAISPELRAKGCESFVDKPWGINTVGGCCGVTGLPFADSEKDYDKEVQDSSCRGNRGCPTTKTSPKIGG